MSSRTVEIDHMHLHIPGLSRDEVNRVGEQVKRNVAERLPRSGPDRNLADLQVNIRIPNGASTDRIAAMISEDILRRIR